MKFFSFFFKGDNNENEDCIISFRFFIREFIINYKAVKKGSDEVSPGSMKEYVQGINRFLLKNCKIDMNKHHLLTDNDEGIFTLMYNHFGEQQSRGLVSKPHNYLSVENLCGVLDHKMYSRDWSVGYLNILFLTIFIIIGARKTGFFQLTVDQFQYS